MKTPLLDAQHVSVTLGGTHLVRDITLHVEQQSIVALLGPNGAGKTTLMHALIGLNPTHSDTTISFADNVITEWRPDERVAAGLVFMPQHSALFGSLSISDNLAVVYDYHPSWQHKPRAQFEEQCAHYLELVGLQSITSRAAGVLSGGQKRKLELVRALLMAPRLIICDEPFAGVDPKSIYELRELFTRVVSEQGVSVMISDHNVEQLMEVADYLYMVLDGTIVAQGTMHDIMKDKTTRERYLGVAFAEVIKKRLF